LDRDGAALEEWEKTTYKVVNQYVALTMVSMMRGVVQFGTATAASSLGVPLAGKTGTGKRPHDVVYRLYADLRDRRLDGLSGKKETAGNDMTGGHGALPMFISFMKDFLKGNQKRLRQGRPECQRT